MVGRMARRHAALRSTPGLAAFRLCILAELDPLTGGVPHPLRWGLLCGWERADARDEFCADGVRAFTQGADEAWGVALETVRVLQGDLWGWSPPTDGVERLARDEPLAIITYARLHARYVPRFTADNRRIVRGMAEDPAVAMKVGFGEHLLVRATFSLWRSQGDAVRFAYGADTFHNPVQRVSLDTPWGDSWFFARLRPLASSGTWHGHDPLAALRPAPAAA